jgi:hypothetical protein
MNEDAAARNEQLFRNVNENIEDFTERLSDADPMWEFICECHDLNCQKTLRATRAEYESVRAVPTHFILAPGHADPRVEHVVFSNERFQVVEKEGSAGKRAEARDPRNHT